MRELLKILNKEKAIYLPYSIYHMHSVYSIVIDEEKDLKKYPVEELDLIINGDDLIKIIDKLLDIIGFKKMIKDYAIVGITAFHSRDKVKSLFYYFNILFDKPSLEKYENRIR